LAVAAAVPVRIIIPVLMLVAQAAQVVAAAV
jgi:hypothetical protein